MSTSTIPTEELSLFTVLIGCTPRGRNIEQHDVMFGVAKDIEGLTPNIKTFWHKPVIADLAAALKAELPGADTSVIEKKLLSTFSKQKTHIDAWICVKYVDGYKVTIRDKASVHGDNGLKLFFINLGGYLENEFEEFHKKIFVVANVVSEALAKAKQHEFMQSHSPESLGVAGSAHLDDQYKIDFEADDIICVSEAIGDDYVLNLEQVNNPTENEMMVGYKRIS